MKKSFISLFGVAALMATFCSCEGMKPNDNLQKVVSGDVFSGKPVSPAEQKRDEEAAREEWRDFPRSYTADRDNDSSSNTHDTTGTLAFQMPL